MKKHLVKTKNIITSAYREKQLLIIITLIMMMGFGSFVMWENTSLKTFTMDFKTVSVSFDYPADFNVDMGTSESHLFLYINHVTDTSNTSQYYNDHFLIFASPNKSIDTRDREVVIQSLNERLDMLMPRLGNPRELSRHQIQVHGNIGIESIQSWSLQSENCTNVKREMVFYTHGYFWEIENSYVISDSVHTGSWDAVFNTITRTFNISDISRKIDTSNKVFRLIEGKARFSFEYSSGLTLDYTRFDDVWEFVNANVFLSSSSEKYDGLEDHTQIEIDVWSPDERNSQSIDDYLEDPLNELKVYAGHGWITAFSLLTRSKATIDGIEANRFACSYNDFEERRIQVWASPQPASILDESRPTIGQFVFFEHNGLVWEISMESNAATYESDAPLFEHILDTFRILD